MTPHTDQEWAEADLQIAKECGPFPSDPRFVDSSDIFHPKYASETLRQQWEARDVCVNGILDPAPTKWDIWWSDPTHVMLVVGAVAVLITAVTVAVIATRRKAKN